MIENSMIMNRVE